MEPVDRRRAFVQIDRLYGYESSTKKDIWLHMTSQSSNTQMEFKDRYEAVVGEFAEQVSLSSQSLLSSSIIPNTHFRGSTSCTRSRTRTTRSS